MQATKKSGIFTRSLTIVAFLYLIILAVLAIPSFINPEFEIINRSPEVISVTASWRRQEKKLGHILPMRSLNFSLADEGGIVFNVKYANGKTLESKGSYFTRGMNFVVTIRSDEIDVHPDFNTW